MGFNSACYYLALILIFVLRRWLTILRRIYSKLCLKLIILCWSQIIQDLLSWWVCIIMKPILSFSTLKSTTLTLFLRNISSSYTLWINRHLSSFLASLLWSHKRLLFRLSLGVSLWNSSSWSDFCNLLFCGFLFLALSTFNMIM